MIRINIIRYLRYFFQLTNVFPLPSLNDFFFPRFILPIVFLFIVVNDILFIRYQIMLKCWEENPSDRPTFAKLKGTMKEMERNHMVSMGYNGDK